MTAAMSTGNVNYAGSVDSSPRSRHTDFDEPTYAAGKGGKLRLMCSYGGYIFPRPHDKSLSYVGGDTRIFVADRNTSLAELSTRLSKTLIGGRPFCLKYQLQNEDLDSLVSVTSDEDLENMIDEYDRASSSGKVSRLRLFLFPSKTESSMKSVDWFVNILNRANSTKVFSETSSVNCLLGLEDDVDAQLEVKNGGNNIKGSTQDVQSVPNSPMVGTTSSFGSTSSMPSLAPIRVHAEENQKGGIEEQFSQMTIGVKQKKYEDGGFMGLSMPPAPETVVSGVPVVVSGEFDNRVFTDDDRKPTQQFQSKPAIPSDLPSPDSVSSEGSVRQRHYFYQEPGFQIQSGSGRFSGNSVSDSSGRAQVKQQQVQDGGYALPAQYDQHQQMLQPHQYVHHTGGQYIHHTPSLPVPMASYYPMYPSQHQTHHQHPSLEHQYPVYFVPARSAQGYSSPLQQTHYSEPTQAVPSNHPQTPLPTTAAYNHARNPQASKPEMVAGAYSSAAVSAPQLVQISSGQHQPQYVAYSQIHHPSQSIAPTSASTTANYTYDPTHAKMYYTQALAPQFSAQYQTMTSAPAVSFPETSSQDPIENLKQQIRTSQT